MLSKIWKLMIIISLIYGMLTGRAEQLGSAAVKSAGDAVTLCISLCGIYALWCGLMKLAEAGGLLNALSRLLSPLIKRLFPQAAKSKEATNAITMNLAANMLGLGNAATPAGQKDMCELKKLSGHDRATDDMVTLLVINNSSLTLVPTTVIALRAQAGSANPSEIFPAALLASAISTVFAVIFSIVLRKKRSNKPKC